MPDASILTTLQAARQWDHMMGGWWGFGIFWWLFWLALLVLVIVLIVRLVRGGSFPSATRDETPLDILKKRYARGDIDREEFEEKKRDVT